MKEKGIITSAVSEWEKQTTWGQSVLATGVKAENADTRCRFGGGKM